MSSPVICPAILSLLQKVAAGSGSLQLAQKAHACTIILGLNRYPLICSSLISAYSHFGCPALSHIVFFQSPSRNIFLWNSLLAAFAKNGCYRHALAAFHYMRGVSDEPPDGYTLAIVAKALAELSDSKNGSAVHSLVKRIGLCSDTVLANTLMLFYFKCDHPEAARQVFEEIPLKTVASWNALIYEHGGKEWELVREMQSRGVKPNGITVSVLLPLCAGRDSAGIILGRQIHCYIVRHELRFDSELHVGCCLINLYCKSGNLIMGRRVFERELRRNVFTWTAMIAGYAECGEFNDALRLFGLMNRVDGIIPNEVTLVTALPAVGSLAAIRSGKQIHGFAFRRYLNAETSVSNALIVMYSKCGSLGTARCIFDDGSWQKDAVSWSSVVSCYGIHGLGGEALSLFKKMCGLGIKVDCVTGVGVLSACSRAGLVKEGVDIFTWLVKDHGIFPSAEMCSCVVDILGRDGRMEEALQFIDSLPSEPKSCIWGALFSAAVSHCNEEIQHLAGEFLLRKEPENPSHYVGLSNFHASFGRWDVVEEVRRRMMGKGLRKSPGLSWIDLNGEVYSFCASDKSHLCSRWYSVNRIGIAGLIEH
ncbi:Pentatricopeptide repeat-containing protein [Platanthera zijinensis]|uniref:Pentatricopeptide repeat-containing protein n=1 Tax=Platanthera zijinensis TaxID=2320716 RepID=A0AAP0G461_9ASPA